MKKKKLSWNQRYLISISECMTSKDIMNLLDINQRVALSVRKQAIDYCLTNDIEMYGSKVPTEAVLKVSGKTIDYYYNKMLLENKANMKGENNASI